MKKTKREISIFLTELGFVEVPSRNSSHIKFRAPNGRLLIAPSSPSDHRAVENLKADARRLLRGSP